VLLAWLLTSVGHFPRKSNKGNILIMSKIIGSLLQGIGLFYFLILPICGSAFGLYALLTGKSEVLAEFGNAATVLSFLGFFPLALLILGSFLVKEATKISCFPNRVFEILAKIVIVPVYIAFAVSLAAIMVPFLAYSYYQYKKGVETGTVRFFKWAVKDWCVTLISYVLLVLSVLIVMFIVM
jgi:hypothetical protein